MVKEISGRGVWWWSVAPETPALLVLLEWWLVLCLGMVHGGFAGAAELLRVTARSHSHLEGENRAGWGC